MLVNGPRAHSHNIVNCNFPGCRAVTQPLPHNLEEQGEAANRAFIRESAGVSPKTASDFGF